MNHAIRVPSIRTNKRLMTAIVIGLGSFPLESALAADDPCTTAFNSTTQEGVPNCEDQVQPAVGYSGWETKGWAHDCNGDHPDDWGAGHGFLNAYEQNNNCFTITENIISEGDDSSKFDATITNWCFKKETLVVTLACSSEPPPKAGLSIRLAAGKAKLAGNPSPDLSGLFSSAPGRLVKVASEAKGSSAGVRR